MTIDTAGAEASTKTKAAMPTQVRQVRYALIREFSDLIDLSDYENRQPSDREQVLLSRSLAALVVRSRTGGDNAAAASMVIDGGADNGIDAVGLADGIPRLWLVQSKWSDSGRASFTVADALKLIEGLRLIDQREFVRFNRRFQHLAERVEWVLQQPTFRITLVIAVMGLHGLSSEVKQRLDDAQATFNGYGAVLDYEVCDARDAWQIVRDDVAEPSIDLVVKMEKWFQLAGPIEAYSGIVAVGEVAQWYAEHGDHLFTRNIRQPLGTTQVNLTLTETLARDPQSFWYFNNGITMLCDSVEATLWSRSAPGGPVTLRLRGASVVNGAQTVAAIHEAIEKDSETAGSGYVGVRVISMAGSPPELATEITKATNTQNRVEPRDFVALDPLQARIHEDFALSLQKRYVVKRGEMDPPPEMGCSVVHAATALACAYHSPELVARARKDPDLLWEASSGGAYRLLFGSQPSAWRIWRSVLLHRAVRTTLYAGRSEREGRAVAIADRGELLIAHLVFQHVGMDGIDDPDSDWDAVLESVPDLTENVLARLIHHVDSAYGATSYISSTFGNPERCRLLAERVLSDLKSGGAIPEMPAEYRPAAPVPRVRRRNAVPILVDAARIPDGTMLVFKAATEPERQALGAWLEEDPRRWQASWVNDRSKPLLWSADGKHYSPSGLMAHMCKLAGWEKAPKAFQGTGRWIVPGEGSLVQLADTVLVDLELEDG